MRHLWLFFGVGLLAITAAGLAGVSAAGRPDPPLAGPPANLAQRHAPLLTNTPLPGSPTDTATPGAVPTVYVCSEFQDVAPADLNYVAIRCVTCQSALESYLCGYGPGEPCVPPDNHSYFRPAQDLTRGQMARLVAIGAGFTEPISPTQQTYTDVPPGHSFWVYIERLAGRALVSGYNCGGPGEPCDPQNRQYYRPDAPLTRALFAEVVSNAAGFTDPPAGQTFTDVPPGTPFYVVVERLASRGLITGYACGGPGEPCDPQNRPYFRPANFITRGDAAGVAAATFFPACPPPPTNTPPPLSPTATTTGRATPTSIPSQPPSKTATATRTGTPATPVPTAATCYSYEIARGTGTIVPGTSRVDTPGCDDCVVSVTLPFHVFLYDALYGGPAPPAGGGDGPPIMKFRLSSNGLGSFKYAVPPVPSSAGLNVCLPAPDYSYTIFGYWDDLRTDGPCDGIYTSITGLAPNRAFNVEWRAQEYAGGAPVNFEMRFYEGQDTFDLVYGRVDAGGSQATIGVQRDPATASEYACNVPGSVAPGLLLRFTRRDCGAPTFTPTAKPSGTPLTATPTWTPGPFCLTPTPCALSFTDVHPADYFYASVRCLACQGILSGYGDGTFRPYSTVTRGQTAKIVANAAGWLEPLPADRQTFHDIPLAQPFWIFVERAAVRGIVSGYACGGPGEPCDSAGRPYFRPYANVTRGQFAKIVTGARGWTDPPPAGQQTFQDVPATHPFWIFVEQAAQHGVISGYACGGPGEPCVPPANRPYFRTNATATRGQAAKIISITFFPGCVVGR